MKARSAPGRTAAHRVTLPLLVAGLLLCSGAPRAAAVSIDLLRDGIALGISAAFAGGSELLVRMAPPVPITSDESYDGLAPYDAAFLFPYSRSGDIASTVMEGASMLMPLAMALADGPPANSLADVVAYGESVGLAIGAKNLIKYLTPRYRPYTYEGGAPGIEPAEDNQSFPSGHATVSFTAAAFTTYLYVEGLPGTAPLLPFVIVNYGLAALTSSYRVLSGMHFISDVLAGTAVGLICGFVVPSLLRPALAGAP